jgi:hypothetical protein
VSLLRATDADGPRAALPAGRGDSARDAVALGVAAAHPQPRPLR